MLACSSNPCQNGAQCFDGQDGTHVCLCAPGYEGFNCETGKEQNQCNVHKHITKSNSPP